MNLKLELLWRITPCSSDFELFERETNFFQIELVALPVYCPKEPQSLSSVANKFLKMATKDLSPEEQKVLSQLEDRQNESEEVIGQFDVFLKSLKEKEEACVEDIKVHFDKFIETLRVRQRTLVGECKALADKKRKVVGAVHERALAEKAEVVAVNVYWISHPSLSLVTTYTTHDI